MTNCRAAATSSALPWAVKNLKAAKINMTMKKATATGQRIPKSKSINVLMLRPGTAFGMFPGLKAKITAGMVKRTVKADDAINFLFMILFN